MDWKLIWAWIVNMAPVIAGKIITCALILLVGKLLMRFIIKRIDKNNGPKKLSDDAKGYIRALVKGVIYVVMIVSVVAVVGIPMASVITVLASAGAAIALAIQGTLSNFAAGIVLLVLKPIHVGNFVELEGVSGTVEEIGLFNTTLATPDNKTVFMPNGKIINDAITNYSLKETRRVEISFRAHYGTDAERMRGILLGVAKKHDLVLADPEPQVVITELSDSSLNFSLRVWTKNCDFWTVKFNLNEQVSKELDIEGITVAFQQIDVHVKNDEK